MSFLWLRAALGEEQLAVLERAAAPAGASRPSGPSMGVGSVIGLGGLCDVLSKILPNARPVRVALSDGARPGNRRLPWRQDRRIAVANRAQVDGFTNWSRRADLWQCEPPVGLLERMIFARVLLDDVDAGGLEIAAGSHCLGRVEAGREPDLAGSYPRITEAGRRGDVLLLPALTLHRPGAARGSRRRIVRVDYAGEALPPPLRWAYQDLSS